MISKKPLLLFIISWITIITNAFTICDPKDFQPVKTFIIEQGALSSVEVYLNKRDNTPYIRKLIPKQSISGKTELKGQQSFTTEVKILEHLDNTGIAPKLLCVSDSPDIGLHEYTKKAGQVYFMMEMVRGKSLADISGDDPKKLQIILKNTARRIYELHENGIIHSDIKPENIMVDDTGKVKLIDFGGSYSATLQLPMDYVHCTKHYCHPSIMNVRERTPAMDWYSFGATALFSRLIKLNPGINVLDEKNLDHIALPYSDKELLELVEFCREGMQFDGDYIELYEKVKELEYFKKQY